jgi:hypothetical protein
LEKPVLQGTHVHNYETIEVCTAVAEEILSTHAGYPKVMIMVECTKCHACDANLGGVTGDQGRPSAPKRAHALAVDMGSHSTPESFML